jgi:peptidyl-prolyl cis-trans isomerase SurA
MMKMRCFFLLAFGCIQQLNAQILFQYGTHSVTEKEFMNAFTKNNANITPKNKAAAIQSYLDLYIKFKLKVQDALDMGLEKVVALHDDVQQFRKQIEVPYLSDQLEIERLAKELCSRSQIELKVSHIFIPIDDKSNAKNKADEVYNRLLKGEDFSNLAVAFSSDPAVQMNKGDLGYITALNLPYVMENIVYNLPLNGFSLPFASSMGFHIFKKTGYRSAKGTLRIAQILLSINNQNDTVETLVVKNLADSLYRVLKKGASFVSLVNQFSTDESSAARGGELERPVASADFDPVFTDAAFALQKDGDFSTPIKTSFGYHIIKRVEHLPVIASYAGNEIFWKQKVEASPRMALAQKAFDQHLLAVTKPQIGQFDAPALWNYTDTFMKTNKKIQSTSVNDTTTLLLFGKEKITTNEWLNYVIGINPTKNTTEYQNLWEPFIKNKAFAYYRKYLETFDENYRLQLKEFMEGNLLFEVMEKRIWTRASSDSLGLRQFFNQHRSKYIWEPSADVLMVSASDSLTAVKARNDVVAFPEKWRIIVSISDGNLLADSNRVQWQEISPNDKKMQPKQVTKIVSNLDQAFTFNYIFNTYPNSSPMQFEAAKGLVINDYQAVLEANWITTLRKKYPVHVNKNVLLKLCRQ